MRYADQQGIDQPAFHHFEGIGKNREIFSRKFSCQLQTFGLQIANRRQMNFGTVTFNDSFHVISADIADTEDTEIDFFHKYIPFPFTYF